MIPLSVERANQLPLTSLPPLSESAGYDVVRGNPEASVGFSVGTWDSKVRVGVWHCTAGAFNCTETGDELQTLIAGRLRLVREDGSREEFVTGDSVFTYKGERLTWDIIEPVTKVFFTYNVAGN